MIGRIGTNSDLVITKHSNQKTAPLAWKIRNTLRWGFLWGWFATKLARAFSKMTGLPVLISELELTLRKANGEIIEYGVVSRRVITDAGVAFIVDAWQNTVELESMQYHGVGTGTNAEAVGDTALQTESTTILNPNNTRATGTQSEPAVNQLRSTGTLTFDGAGAITEHGLFSQSATGGGTLFDRSVFSVVNVNTADSISAQYTVTFTSGS
jgi:hypothetical protein